MHHKTKVKLKWFEAESFENDDDMQKHLAKVDAILVPGGFGERGAEGKIAAARYARENKVPYLGICFGMQMAVIEAARNLAGIADATSSEFGACEAPVVGLMTEWHTDDGKEKRGEDGDLGGTMRLGAYPCAVRPGTRLHDVYGTEEIFERHRHRYEVNIAYQEKLEAAGMLFSGVSPDGNLPECVELKNHPWYIGVQFHPELKSKPFDPHPLFTSFVKAAIDHAADV
jgi:CTP synthase